MVAWLGWMCVKYGNNVKINKVKKENTIDRWDQKTPWTSVESANGMNGMRNILYIPHLSDIFSSSLSFSLLFLFL